MYCRSHKYYLKLLTSKPFNIISLAIRVSVLRATSIVTSLTKSFLSFHSPCLSLINIVYYYLVRIMEDIR